MENKYDKITGKLTDSLDETQMKEFYSSVNEDKGFRKTYFQLKDLWDATRYHNKKKSVDLDQEWGLLNGRMTKTIALNKWTWMKVAAMVVVMFGVGWFANSLMDGSTKEQWHMLIAERGEIVHMELSDGTNVWLNSDSKLSFPSSFNKDNRTVKLEGEGYFEVEKETNRKFIVEAKHQQVEVLGTKFNISAYPQDTVVRTTLRSGSIRLISDKQTLVLKPGEQARLIKADGTVTVAKVSPDMFSDWHDGRMEFRNSKLKDLIPVLERWYSVKVVLAQDELGKQTFSGRIYKKNDITEILEIFSKIGDLEYKIEEDIVTITSREE
ncbi:DUF4974 domain-containing protein [Puteibacter caeruleilacunae]|nr:DUF4974 domain-containing protein [Puteibacter caeruleilacunae]